MLYYITLHDIRSLFTNSVSNPNIKNISQTKPNHEDQTKMDEFSLDLVTAIGGRSFESINYTFWMRNHQPIRPLYWMMHRVAVWNSITEIRLPVQHFLDDLLNSLIWTCRIWHSVGAWPRLHKIVSPTEVHRSSVNIELLILRFVSDIVY